MRLWKVMEHIMPFLKTKGKYAKSLGAGHDSPMGAPDAAVDGSLPIWLCDD
jgi:hypothetical protein